MLCRYSVCVCVYNTCSSTIDTGSVLQCSSYLTFVEFCGNCEKLNYFLTKTNNFKDVRSPFEMLHEIIRNDHELNAVYINLG